MHVRRATNASAAARAGRTVGSPGTPAAPQQAAAIAIDWDAKERSAMSPPGVSFLFRGTSDDDAAAVEMTRGNLCDQPSPMVRIV